MRIYLDGSDPVGFGDKAHSSTSMSWYLMEREIDIPACLNKLPKFSTKCRSTYTRYIFWIFWLDDNHLCLYEIKK